MPGGGSAPTAKTEVGAILLGSAGYDKKRHLLPSQYHANPKEHFLEVLTLETEAQASKSAATLDSDSLRKIPRARAKPGQKSHTANCGLARRHRVQPRGDVLHRHGGDRAPGRARQRGRRPGRCQVDI
jgi:hypothetical protein